MSVSDRKKVIQYQSRFPYLRNCKAYDIILLAKRSNLCDKYQLVMSVNLYNVDTIEKYILRDANEEFEKFQAMYDFLPQEITQHYINLNTPSQYHKYIKYKRKYLNMKSMLTHSTR